VNNPDEVRDWASIMFDRIDGGSSVAPYLADVAIESSPPAWGNAAAWEAHLARRDLWLLAHAKWRVDEEDVAVEVSLHGRGVRVRDSSGGLDVLCFDFREFDRALNEFLSGE
jgi:hypothetical protein